MCGGVDGGSVCGGVDGGGVDGDGNILPCSWGEVVQFFFLTLLVHLLAVELVFLSQVMVVSIIFLVRVESCYWVGSILVVHESHEWDLMVRCFIVVLAIFLHYLLTTVTLT